MVQSLMENQQVVSIGQLTQSTVKLGVMINPISHISPTLMISLLVKAQRQAPAEDQRQAPAEAQRQAPVEAQQQAPVEAQQQAPVEAQRIMRTETLKPIQIQVHGQMMKA